MSWGCSKNTTDIAVHKELERMREEAHEHHKLMTKIFTSILIQQEKYNHLLEKMVKKQGEFE